MDRTSAYLPSQTTLQSWPKVSPILKFQWPNSGLQYCTKIICSLVIAWTNIGPMDQYIYINLKLLYLNKLINLG